MPTPPRPTRPRSTRRWHATSGPSPSTGTSPRRTTPGRPVRWSQPGVTRGSPEPEGTGGRGCRRGWGRAPEAPGPSPAEAGATEEVGAGSRAARSRRQVPTELGPLAEELAQMLSALTGAPRSNPPRESQSRDTTCSSALEWRADGAHPARARPRSTWRARRRRTARQRRATRRACEEAWRRDRIGLRRTPLAERGAAHRRGPARTAALDRRPPGPLGLEPIGAEDEGHAADRAVFEGPGGARLVGHRRGRTQTARPRYLTVRRDDASHSRPRPRACGAPCG